MEREGVYLKIGWKNTQNTTWKYRDENIARG